MSKAKQVQKRYCAVQSCENNKGSTNPDVTFFKPPLEENLHAKWLEAIRQHHDIKNLTYVCSLHFEQHSIFRTKGRNALIYGAIPTIFNHRNDNAFESETCETYEPTVMNETNKQVSNEETIVLDALEPENRVRVQKLLSELRHKLWLQTNLTLYWKSVALKYEPQHKDPYEPANRNEFEHVLQQETMEPDEQPSNFVCEYLTEESVVLENECVDFMVQNEDSGDIPKSTPFKPYQCAICDECFEMPTDLEKHMKTHFPGKFTRTNNGGPIKLFRLRTHNHM